MNPAPRHLSGGGDHTYRTVIDLTLSTPPQREMLKCFLEFSMLLCLE